jgi:hypothetical protein
MGNHVGVPNGYLLLTITCFKENVYNGIWRDIARHIIDDMRWVCLNTGQFGSEHGG